MPVKIDVPKLILILSVIAGFALIAIFGSMALLTTVAGVFVVFNAFMDYDWFMKSYKAAPLVFLFGRDGTRVIYIILGIVIFFMGLMSLFHF